MINEDYGQDSEDAPLRSRVAATRSVELRQWAVDVASDLGTMGDETTLLSAANAIYLWVLGANPWPGETNN